MDVKPTDYARISSPPQQMAFGKYSKNELLKVWTKKKKFPGVTQNFAEICPI